MIRLINKKSPDCRKILKNFLKLSIFSLVLREQSFKDLITDKNVLIRCTNDFTAASAELHTPAHRCCSLLANVSAVALTSVFGAFRHKLTLNSTDNTRSHRKRGASARSQPFSRAGRV